MRSSRERTRSWFAVAPAVVAMLSFGTTAGVAGGDEPPAPRIPPDAPDPEALRELGRRLFFDPVASSRSGMRACADCHDPDHGFSDPDRFSVDDTRLTSRHSQAILDGGDAVPQHWDGEFSSVAALVRGRLLVTFDGSGEATYLSELRLEGRGPVDPPSPDDPPPPPFDGFVRRSAARALPRPSRPDGARIDRYAEAVHATFGPGRAQPLKQVVRAIEHFCHSIQSSASAYDRFEAGDTSALSAQAARGRTLFRGRAGCAQCHHTSGERAPFTDHAFHDTGIAWRALSDGRAGALADGPQDAGDLGRARVTGDARELRAFKTPTLRDVARRGPFMHDGSLATLEDVVHHYARRPRGYDALDARFPRFHASGTDVADLVAFLESLTSDVRPGRAPIAWGERAAVTTLTFRSVDGAPLAGLRVRLVPAGDVLPGPLSVKPRVQMTSNAGEIRFAPGMTTHTRLVLPDGVVPIGGDLVPDTCRTAAIVVPILGRGRLVVPGLFRENSPPPDEILVRHPDAPTLPNRQPPVTTFRLVPGVSHAGGAVYEGAVREDTGPGGVVEWPSRSGGLRRAKVLLQADRTIVVDFSG